MQFEWDEAKRVANAAKHGIDFRTAIELFDGRPAIIFTAPIPTKSDLSRRASSTIAS
jgi:uncharacterized DUF497 family protein